MKSTLAIAAACLFLSSCTIIRQDEAAVKRQLGKLGSKVYSPGPRLLNPFTTRYIKVPMRTVNLEIKAALPSKEGLTVNAEISILYQIKQKELPNILQNTGLDFQDVLILPLFRSSSADICAKFDAKDMHSAKRAQIEREIKERMMEVLDKKGFVIEAVLMKSISLPAGLSKTIEEKLQAEQEAQRMEFIKQKEKLEADRKLIQAEGDKAARIIAAEGQKRATELEAEGKAIALTTEAAAVMKSNTMINSGLSNAVLKYKAIEAFIGLSKSNNTKIIITDGKTPIVGLDATDVR
jgi:regulator of protease activity HflC (stomatin/prohibitin superfamily)